MQEWQQQDSISLMGMLRYEHPHKHSFRFLQTNDRLMRKFIEAKRLRPHKTCALMLEVRGREIRTSEVTDPNGINLRSGQQLFIETQSHMLPSTQDVMYCNYKDLPRSVKPNEIIFIDDGKIVCLVTECDAVSIQLIKIINWNRKAQQWR